MTRPCDILSKPSVQTDIPLQIQQLNVNNYRWQYDFHTYDIDYVASVQYSIYIDISDFVQEYLLLMHLQCISYGVKIFLY